MNSDLLDHANRHGDSVRNFYYCYTTIRSPGGRRWAAAVKESHSLAVVLGWRLSC